MKDSEDIREKCRERACRDAMRHTLRDERVSVEVENGEMLASNCTLSQTKQNVRVERTHRMYVEHGKVEIS